ncbi:putative inorganic phosphate cotransporter [Colias croceus]|uniref:putative inorganic phosphate cotransporter n=1 Tax=Colias crocea TaxID=72248 RepID=UPI001E280CEE|nr:putative inorganic phosphate cotransporter [Colias croceus]
MQNGKDNMESVQDKSEIIIDDCKVSDWGYRHKQCILLFLALTSAYSMRTCMGMALVVMTDIEPINTSNTSALKRSINDSNISMLNLNTSNLDYEINDTNVGVVNETSFLHSLLLIPPYPTFKWNKKIQDTVQSSFFWGYMLTQIPAGTIAHHFGAKYLLTGAMLINGVLSFCLPWASSYGGWILTGIFRFVQGLAQACIIPGMHTMFGKWAPLEERGRMTAFAYSGQALGAVLGFPVAGFISSSFLGWPGIFRFYGVLLTLVGGFLWWLSADSPAQHKYISAAERYYIESSLGQVGDAGKKKQAVPWVKILRCRGLYAIMLAHIGQTWCQVTLFAEVPAYMDKVMGVNVKANGLLSALPFLIMWFASFFFSWLSDMLIVRKVFSVTVARKLANSTGAIPASIFFIILAHTSRNIYIVETLLCIICAFKIACSVGFQVNHIDISPNFSGTMMGMTNFMANCFGSIAPMVAGFILTDVTDEYLWRKVFYLAAIIYFSTNAAYVIMGTGELADWNEPEEEKDLPEMERMMKDKELEKK